MGEEQNDLLNFFNKKDKLKTAAVPVKKAAPKKEEIVEPKVEAKPGKAVQDLRAIRDAKDKTDDQDSSEGSKTPETAKSFAWSAQPTTKPTHKPSQSKDKKIPTQQQFPTLKQAMSGEAYQTVNNMPTMSAPAPTPVSNAFTGLEDELAESDEETEKEKEVETEKAEKPKKPKATTQPKKAGEAKKKAAEKPKKAKSQTEEDVDKLMADLGLAEKGGKKKGKKK